MRTILLALALACASLFATTTAAEFRLANGNTLRGDIASADEDGLIVRLDVGGFSKREPWVAFSQQTLRELAQDKTIAPLVEPFIELDPSELKAREKQKEITVRDVPTRLERPSPRPGLIAGFISPIGLAMLAALFAANLFAAYEIALYRHRPPAVVCVASCVLPLLAPVLFLALPGHEPAPGEETATPATAASPAASKTTGVVGSGVKAPAGLSLASLEKPAAASPTAQPQTYNRGEHTFNRRFFESKFAGFFRVVPSEAEKDLVLIFRTAKTEYVARRISRISMNELHAVLQSNNSEVNLPFAEITSVTLRHKDARS